MNDSRVSLSYEFDFVRSVVLKCSELLEMIGFYWCQDSDIRMSDREEEVHLPRMIDPILEHEISRIWSYDTPESYSKNPNPEKWIAPRRSSPDDRQWESVFPIVVIERVSY